MERTLFWVEDGVVHTATSTISRTELMRIVDDLL
jgi:hypothetical protein